MPSKLFQYSSITSLFNGNFTGEISFADFKNKGNFGLGTFDGLDGEMVALDGVYYQMLSDGSVNVVDNKYTSPFLLVCDFQSDLKLSLTDTKQAEILELMLKPETNSKMFGMKITGTFSKVVTRTVNKQKKPYKKMSQLENAQGEKTFTNQTGTVVGFFTPKYLNTLGVEGVHFHFLTSDLKSGGHVLNLEVKQADLELCEITEMELKFGKQYFEQGDYQAEIKKIEGHND